MFEVMASLLHLHLLSFLVLLLNPSSAQTFPNITLGSTLSTLNQNPYWLSPSGEFAFGFYSIKPDLFLLSIWFAKIPPKTIVWTANRDQPVEKGSMLQLTSNGVLCLTNTTGSEIWKAESSNSTTLVSTAALLNTGNFVLQSNDSTILWASFDEPSDTILPGQTLDRTRKLVARYTEQDQSSGRFQLLLRPFGNLVLQERAYPAKNPYIPYWTSNTENTNSQLVFNESGYICLNSPNGTIYNIASETPVSTRDFYQRATIDFDGVFRKYTYRKSGTSESEGWSVSWSVPGNICTQITGDDVGSGACGYNSYCIMGQDQRPSCECPPGYDYLDSNNSFKGCKQRFAPQSCKIGDGLGGFEMRELINTDWPYSDYEHFMNVDEDWCSKTCLDDCFCAVFIIRGGECWLKKTPLSNGRRDPSVEGKALIKVGNSSLQTVLPPPPQLREDKKNKKDRDHQMILPGLIILGSSLFLNLLLLVNPRRIYRKHKRGFKLKPNDHVANGGNLIPFTYRELEQATDGFKDELGKGAFSVVYKGVLCPSAGGGLVAVKKLEKIVQEVDKEFKTEMTAIGRTNHKNLVRLLGFCDEGTHRLLVYEFMSNGSLANLLFQNPRPSWCLRIQIAFGIARGLAYLHEECSTQIIHCDVKPQNILIDESFTARISDFGLAKLLKSDQTRTRTGIRGTRGYVAPEWFKSKAITAKVDVYSFGIMLMEIIFCRKNAEFELGEEQVEILSECVYDSYVEGQLHLLVGNDEEAKNDARSLVRMVMVAIWCVQDDPSLRPSMRKVTQMLEGAVDVPNPPDPST